jgi:hypothetical protein
MDREVRALRDQFVTFNYSKVSKLSNSSNAALAHSMAAPVQRHVLLPRA